MDYRNVIGAYPERETRSLVADFRQICIRQAARILQESCVPCERGVVREACGIHVVRADQTPKTVVKPGVRPGLGESCVRGHRDLNSRPCNYRGYEENRKLLCPEPRYSSARAPSTNGPLSPHPCCYRRPSTPNRPLKKWRPPSAGAAEPTGLFDLSHATQEQTTLQVYRDAQESPAQARSRPSSRVGGVANMTASDPRNTPRSPRRTCVSCRLLDSRFARSRIPPFESDRSNP